jgi:excisionase family DNA binding protein
MKRKKSVEVEVAVVQDLPKKELLRIDEAADYFSVTTKTIYLWIDHGLLEAEKLGGVLRVPRSSIDKFRLVGKERLFNKYAQ